MGLQAHKTISVDIKDVQQKKRLVLFHLYNICQRAGSANSGEILREMFRTGAVSKEQYYSNTKILTDQIYRVLLRSEPHGFCVGQKVGRGHYFTITEKGALWCGARKPDVNENYLKAMFTRLRRNLASNDLNRVKMLSDLDELESILTSE